MELQNPRGCFLGVPCRACGEPIPLFDDPSGDSEGIGGAGKLVARCPACAHRAVYPMADLRSFAWAEHAALAPAFFGDRPAAVSTTWPDANGGPSAAPAGGSLNDADAGPSRSGRPA